jgi:hypothetical protein
MSYDFDTTLQICDHRIVRERYVIDSGDFRTLKLASDPSLLMRAPVNGLSLVQVSISGQLVPEDDPVFGYSFSPDTNRIGTIDRFTKIVFNHQVRFVIPLIEVTYLTTKPFCLKCSGTGTLNDLKTANSGGFLIIADTNKLVQRSLKYILTSRCPFYPALTCPLKTYVGRKVAQASVADVSGAVMTALQNFKRVQGAQATVQFLTPLETLKDITNVAVVPVNGDPTAVSVAAQISSYGSTATVPIGFSIRTNSLTQGQ